MFYLFLAMVKKLDDSVGGIVKALYNKGILENTIIVFVSDNGGVTTGMYQNYASNYPLRGLKVSPFEGGVRVVGLVWSTSLKNPGRYWDGYMHVADWLPTLLSTAGVKVPTNIDGINQWDSINLNATSKRKIMYEIDDYMGYASMIQGDYKLVTGYIDENYTTYQGGDLRGIIGKAPSYTDAISNSDVYNVLKSLGRPFNMSYLGLRNKMLVKCRPPPACSCLPTKGIICKIV